jgi:hydrogenase-4 component F
MTTLVIVIAVLPLAGTVAAIIGVHARLSGYIAIAAASGSLALAIWLLAYIGQHRSFTALAGFVYIDGLSAFFLFTVAVVVLLASLGSAAYVRAEQDSRQLTHFQVRMYFGFFGAFAALMLGSLGMEPRSASRRCTPGCPTRTPRRPAQPARCCPRRC